MPDKIQPPTTSAPQKNLINLSRNGRVFFDYPSPFAVGFARPFVGRVQAHFAAKSVDGSGKVKIVDGGIFTTFDAML
ncbi:hypothetical protein A7Q01_05015 [Eikenella sp. NML96-A-049]|nr:hypothetical protein A7P97_02365 [Eikenella sp. NML070372]OAM38835.1 hypothetical protein A7Q01_05015 [Eikenella sp. NML96-A-049]